MITCDYYHYYRICYTLNMIVYMCFGAFLYYSQFPFFSFSPDASTFVLFCFVFSSVLFASLLKWSEEKIAAKKNDTQRNREIEREREREPHSMCLDIIFFHICFLKSEKEHEKKEFALVIDFSAFVWLLLLLIMMIMAMHQLRLFVS